MLPRPLFTALTVLISLAWAVNVVIGFVDPSRHDPSINAIFAVVVGAVYALSHANGKGRGLRKKLGQLIAGDDDTPEDEQ